MISEVLERHGLVLARTASEFDLYSLERLPNSLKIFGVDFKKSSEDVYESELNDVTLRIYKIHKETQIKVTWDNLHDGATFVTILPLEFNRLQLEKTIENRIRSSVAGELSKTVRKKIITARTAREDVSLPSLSELPRTIKVDDTRCHLSSFGALDFYEYEYPLGSLTLRFRLKELESNGVIHGYEISTMTTFMSLHTYKKEIIKSIDIKTLEEAALRGYKAFNACKEQRFVGGTALDVVARVASEKREKFGFEDPANFIELFGQKLELKEANEQRSFMMYSNNIIKVEFSREWSSGHIYAWISNQVDPQRNYRFRLDWTSFVIRKDDIAKYGLNKAITKRLGDKVKIIRKLVAGNGDIVEARVATETRIRTPDDLPKVITINNVDYEFKPLKPGHKHRRGVKAIWISTRRGGSILWVYNEVQWRPDSFTYIPDGRVNTKLTPVYSVDQLVALLKTKKKKN